MQLSTPPLLRRQASRKWMLGTCSLFSPQTQAGCNLPTRKAQPGLYRSWVPKRSDKFFRSRYLSRALVPPAERDLHIQNGQPTCCANGMADAELLGELCAKRHRVCPFYFVVCARCVDQQSSNHSRPIHAGRFKNTPIFQQNNARSSHQCRQRAKLDPGGGSYVPLLARPEGFEPPAPRFVV
jgi:hypothetical protein